MKALAYHDYESGHGYLCCACVEREQRESDLFFAMVKPVRVDGQKTCQRCSDMLGSEKAEDAAQRIAGFITSGSWPGAALEGKPC